MRWLLVVFAALAPATVCAQRLASPLDPVTVTSTSGGWSLHVDPSTWIGKGPASYRLAHEGEAVWSGDLPCTLRDVALGSDGAFAGTAPTADGGLELMLVGPDGTVRFDETLPYEGAAPDVCTWPRSFGVVFDGGDDRMLFRIEHDSQHAAGDEWHVVRCATGQPLPAVSEAEAPRGWGEQLKSARTAARAAERGAAGTASAVSALTLEFLGAIELQTGASAGLVDRVVGDAPDAPDAAALGHVECALVDPLGRFALADRRTHAVHVFDRSGARTAVCEFTAPELADGGEVTCLAFSPDGHLHAGIRRSLDFREFFTFSHVDFDVTGAHGRDERIRGVFAFQPAGERRWVADSLAIRLLDADGSCLKTIARAPDDRWLSGVGEPAVAPDGSLAVISRGALAVFASDGAPVVSVPLPADVPSDAHLAFTGPRVYLGFGAKLWRVDLASRAILATTLGAEQSPDVSAPCAWRADAGELWSVDEKAKRVLRYRDRSP